MIRNLSSLKNKLLVPVLGVFVIQSFMAALGVVGMRRIMGGVELIHKENLPLLLCVHRAGEALQSSSRFRDMAMIEVASPHDYDKVRAYESEFQRNEIEFDMYMKALIWGSESDAFQRVSGGLTYAEWQRSGLAQILKVLQAPDAIRKYASEADLYFSGYTNNALRAMSSHRRGLRLLSGGEAEKAQEAQKEVLSYRTKSQSYAGRVREIFTQMEEAVDAHVDQTITGIHTTYAATLKRVLIFCISLLILQIVGATIFATRVILAPIRVLRDGTEALGQGNLKTRLSLNSHDELGELACSFNAMANNLEDITVSRDQLNDSVLALERSNQEQKKAEAELRKTNVLLQEAQQQLIQAAKLESIGRLAAGAAHEVKNPLAVLLMGVEYLNEHWPTTFENQRTVVAEMRDAVRRADIVIKGLLDFSSHRLLEPRSTALQPIIESALLLVKHELSKTHIIVTTYFEAQLPSVWLDTTKMEQVLINLFMNAIHAQPTGGALEIRVARYAASDTQELFPGQFSLDAALVRIEINDSGPGIPEAVLPKIFEPFFTTKPTGQGTGLGLPVTQTIIQLHQGAIDIRNRPEGGARVTIVLPALQKDTGQSNQSV